MTHKPIYPVSKLTKALLESGPVRGLRFKPFRSENIFNVRLYSGWQGNYLITNEANGDKYFAASIAEAKEYINLH